MTEMARGYPGVPTVFMLAAGMGSRVGSLGNGRPRANDSCARASPLPRGPGSPGVLAGAAADVDHYI